MRLEVIQDNVRVRLDLSRGNIRFSILCRRRGHRTVPSLFEYRSGRLARKGDVRVLTVFAWGLSDVGRHGRDRKVG